MARDLFSQHEEPVVGKSLRPHQVRAIELLRQSLARKNRRVVISAPTGFGKTLTAAKIIQGAREKGNRVIFTAPAVSLIDQTIAAFEAEGIRDIGAMQANHPRTDPSAAVQVASVQTLARRQIPDAALVIVDECHIKAAAVETLMDERPDCFFVGLSATPWARGMGLRWQDMVVPCTIESLIEDGYLSKFSAFAPDEPNLTGVKRVAGDYAEGALAEIMADGKLVSSVVATWLARGEDRPTLCFCVNRNHARAVHEEFIRAGICSEYVDAFTDSVERAHINRRFREGEVRVICSVRTMTTGVDLPVSCIIDAAPTLSEMLHVQKIGRGLRVNPGTEDLVILDHAGNSLRLGLVTQIQHDALDTTPPGEKQKPRGKAEKMPKPCPKCETLVMGLLCPFCGHERQPVSGVETVEGDLVEITGKVKIYSREVKQQWWSGIQTIKAARSKSDGWAAHIYRDKFGVWPRDLRDTPGEATQEMWNFVKSRAIAFAKKMEAERVKRHESGHHAGAA